MPELLGSTISSALGAVGATGGQIATFNTLAAGANGALAQAPAGLTAQGAAAFLATCAEESAWFRTTTEYGSNLSYDPYRGRTFIQLTWQSNYAAFGQWCHAKGLLDDPNAFVANPASLGDIKWAWLGAVMYFETHGLWAYANRGDFLAVSQAVNGGNGRIGTSFVPNGWTERKAAYAVFLAANITAPTATATHHGDNMIENYEVSGTGDLKLNCPVGSASAITAAAWVSASLGDATQGKCQVWFQDDTSGKSEVDWTLTSTGGHSNRAVAQLPDGTTEVNIHYQFNGPGVITLETQSK